MLNIGSFFSHFQNASSASSLVSATAFLTENFFVCKGGQLGAVLRINGPDAECLTDERLEAKTRHFERAMALLDQRFQVNQYLFRSADAKVARKDAYPLEVTTAKISRRAKHLESKGLHAVDSYLVILMDHKGSDAFALSAGKRLKLVENETIANLELLRSKVAAFIAQLSREIRCELLERQEVFSFLYRFQNLDSAAPALKSDNYLDYYLANREIRCHPDGYLQIGDQHVRVYSMKDTPMQSFSNLFRGLQNIEGNLIVSNQWRVMPNDRALGDIKGLRQHFHQERYSWRQAMQSALMSDGKSQAPSGEILVEESADEHIRNLGELKKEIINGAKSLGIFSLTVVAYDRDKRRLREIESEIIRVFAGKEAVMIPENYNLLHQFVSVMPGNETMNIRQLKILNTNHADMSFVFGTDSGDVRNESLRDEYLAVFETNHSSLHYLNLHHRGVLGAFAVGKTGSGKSTLLNELVSSAQKYSPYTFIFDIGGSYRETTRRHNGSYFELSLDRNECRFNPFALPNTSDNREFLFHFCRGLITLSDDYKSTTKDDEELHSAIAFVLQQKPKFRRLSSLASALPKNLAGFLNRWIAGGQYGPIFDNETDSLALARFQTFDLQGMEQHKQLVGPVLMYLLFRVQSLVKDPELLGTSKWIWIDEAWKFLSQPTLAAWLREAIKTFRKHNSGCVFATQGALDLGDGDLRETIRESCEMQMFLYNPNINAKLYADLFDLNEKEIEIIKALEDKRQFLFRTPRSSIVLNYTTDAETLLEYSNSPFEVLQRQELTRAATVQ